MRHLACMLLLAAQAVLAQSEPLTVTKIDPPNWYSTLPAPLLLVHGTGLDRARFSLSDRHLSIQRVAVSENGHWAQLFLNATPAQPETVDLTVSNGSSRLKLPYTFAAPRPANDGAAGFNARDVMYLIMTDRFADGDLTNDGPDAHSAASSPEAEAEHARPRGWHGGDLRGIQQHLDYLQSLGITTVWITPVYVNAEPGSYHGYGATDLYGVDPHFGSLTDLQNLAKALHSRGMKLVLDTVPNHVGPAHPWVTDEPTPNWFHGTAANHIEAQTDFRALMNPHAPERDRDATLHGWFANTLPDMNTDDPTVAQYLRQNAVWWIEQTGADGLRIDTFPYVNRGFWNGFNGELKTLFPHLTEVGEVFNPDPEITSAFADGNTLAGQDTHLYTPFDFPTFFATGKVFAKGEPLSLLADVLAKDELYAHPERLVPFLGNHDTARFAQEVPDPALRNLAFDYLMTTRGMPQIYSGDEIAMPGHGDPDDRRDFPGGFAEAASATAASQTTASAFDPATRTHEEQAQFTTVQQLATLRHDHPTLACGAQQVLAAGKDLLVYARYGTAGCPGNPLPRPETLLVVLERGTPTPVQLDLHNTVLEGCTLAQPITGQASAQPQSTPHQVTLSPQTAFAVLPCR